MAQLEKENAELQELLAAAKDQLSRCTCGASASTLLYAPTAEPSLASTGTFPSPMPSTELFQGVQGFDFGDATNGESLDGPSSLGLSTVPLLFQTTLRDLTRPEALVFSFARFDYTSVPGTPAGTAFDILPLAWPKHLPPPIVVHHLVETFFASVPLASRLIHKPSFMMALAQPPMSPHFPNLALLHAICAMASLYSPIPEKDQGLAGLGQSTHLGIGFELDELLWGTHKDRFGPVQIFFASQDLKAAIQDGHRLLQMLQASIICTWYSYSMGMTIGVYSFMAAIHNLIGPLGVYSSEGYEPLSRQPPDRLFLFKRPATPLEIETLTNVFWIAYVTLRVYNAGSSWPLAFSDDDISQMLPCRFSDFIAGEFVPTRNRQRMFTDGLLVTHPSLTTDSWTLYIKATILLSNVRSFNCRYRMSVAKRVPSSVMEAPTASEEFKSLDQAISSFLREIPRTFREPVGTTVDPILYMAHLLPHVAMLQLHDPHAKLGSPNDYSANQMLAAIQAIVDLIYKVCGTSYDLLYMDHSCSFCWCTAGAAIIRLLKVKIQERDATEVKRLEEELGVIKFVLRNMGDRTVIGHRQVKVLEDLYDGEIRGSVQKPMGSFEWERWTENDSRISAQTD